MAKCLGFFFSRAKFVEESMYFTKEKLRALPFFRLSYPGFATEWQFLLNIFIINDLRFIYCLGQNARKFSMGKGRKVSQGNQGTTAGDGFGKSQLQPTIQEEQPKLESKVAKMIEKAEQRRQKRIKRQKEVRHDTDNFIL